MSKRKIPAESLDFLKRIVRTIKRDGIASMEKRIAMMEVEGSSQKAHHISAIIHETAAAYGTTFDKVVHRAADRSGTRSSKEHLALKTSYLLIITLCEVSPYQVSKYFEHDSKRVYRAVQEYEKMNPSIKQHRRFIDEYKRLHDKLYEDINGNPKPKKINGAVVLPKPEEEDKSEIKNPQTETNA